MKTLSASIIVSTGLICFTATVIFGQGDTQQFAMFVLGIVAAIALAMWLRLVLLPFDS